MKPKGTSNFDLQTNRQRYQHRGEPGLRGQRLDSLWSWEGEARAATQRHQERLPPWTSSQSRFPSPLFPLSGPLLSPPPPPSSARPGGGSRGQGRGGRPPSQAGRRGWGDVCPPGSWEPAQGGRNRGRWDPPTRHSLSAQVSCRHPNNLLRLKFSFTKWQMN